MQFKVVNLEQFQNCIFTSLTEQIADLPGPLFQEPPSIIQWLYDYLSGNEVRVFRSALLFLKSFVTVEAIVVY